MSINHVDVHVAAKIIVVTMLCYRKSIYVKEVKAVPLQAWSGPEGSRKFRFPDFMTTAQDGGKVKVKQSCYRPGVFQRVPGS